MNVAGDNGFQSLILWIIKADEQRCPFVFWDAILQTDSLVCVVSPSLSLSAGRALGEERVLVWGSRLPLWHVFLVSVHLPPPISSHCLQLIPTMQGVTTVSQNVDPDSYASNCFGISKDNVASVRFTLQAAFRILSFPVWLGSTRAATFLFGFFFQWNTSSISLKHPTTQTTLGRGERSACQS